MGAIESINFECLKASVSAYENSCGQLSEYGMKYVRVFANLCNSQFQNELSTMIPQ